MSCGGVELIRDMLEAGMAQITVGVMKEVLVPKVSVSWKKKNKLRRATYRLAGVAFDRNGERVLLR